MLADQAIHVLARTLLRVCAPIRAHAILLRVGARLPALRTPEQARRVVASLVPRGTCLSRSLTVAARTPGAEVVIGVAPRERRALHAHAWIEMDGVPLDAAEVSGAVIARLGRPDRTR